MEAIIAGYVEYLTNQGMSQLSVTKYKSCITIFSRWLEDSGSSLDKLTRVDLLEFRRYLQGHKRYSTVNGYLLALQHLIGYMSKNDLTFITPEEGVALLDLLNVAKNFLPKALTDQEVLELRRVAERMGDPIDRVIVELGLCCGLRVNEMCQIQVKDLSIGERHGRIVVRGKGSKEAVVLVPQRARQVIHNQLTMMPQPIQPDDHLLRSRERRNKGLTTCAVWQRIKKLGKAAGLPNLTVHSLRHTFGTILVAKGASINVVMDLMRHERITTTIRYLKPRQEDLEKALDVL